MTTRLERETTLRRRLGALPARDQTAVLYILATTAATAVESALAVIEDLGAIPAAGTIPAPAPLAQLREDLELAQRDEQARRDRARNYQLPDPQPLLSNRFLTLAAQAGVEPKWCKIHDGYYWHSWDECPLCDERGAGAGISPVGENDEAEGTWPAVSSARQDGDSAGELAPVMHADGSIEWPPGVRYDPHASVAGPGGLCEECGCQLGEAPGLHDVPRCQDAACRAQRQPVTFITAVQAPGGDQS